MFEHLVPLDHYFLKHFEILDQQDLLYDLPVVFVLFGFLAAFQELLLGDADVREHFVQQSINHLFEYLVDFDVVISLVIFLSVEMDAVRFDEGLDGGLPLGTLEECIDCIKHPGCDIFAHYRILLIDN